MWEEKDFFPVGFVQNEIIIFSLTLAFWILIQRQTYYAGAELLVFTSRIIDGASALKHKNKIGSATNLMKQKSNEEYFCTCVTLNVSHENNKVESITSKK